MTLTRSRLIEAVACASYQHDKKPEDKPWHRLHPAERDVFTNALELALRSGVSAKDLDPMSREVGSILGLVRA